MIEMPPPHPPPPAPPAPAPPVSPAPPTPEPRPLRLKEMVPEDVQRRFAADPRLLIPVGTCEQHGPHLPLGCDAIIVDRLADDLSAEFGVVRSPTIEYGVNAETERASPGNAGVRRKTLRRWLNDLVLAWEREGIEEFLILTAHGHQPHQEALSTVITDRARVLVIDILSINLETVVDDPKGPIHGGEVDTSLMLFIAPELVRTGLAQDFVLEDRAVRRYRRGSTAVLPAISPGSVGRPTLASAEKGRRIYEHIRRRIREHVFAGRGASQAASGR